MRRRFVNLGAFKERSFFPTARAPDRNIALGFTFSRRRPWFLGEFLERFS